jgi:hypothetical protein
MGMRDTQLVLWKDVAAGMKATPFRGLISAHRVAVRLRRATEKAETLERAALSWDTAPAEQAVVPRTGASNDGEAEADTEPRSASNMGVANAT